MAHVNCRKQFLPLESHRHTEIPTYPKHCAKKHEKEFACLGICKGRSESDKPVNRNNIRKHIQNEVIFKGLKKNGILVIFCIVPRGIVECRCRIHVSTGPAENIISKIRMSLFL